MRFKIASPIQIWGSVLLLSWSSLLYAQEEKVAAPPKDDPLVVKPMTVEGKFSAALFMLKVARPDLAKYYLEQTLADNPSEEDLLAMRKAHGMGTFLQLTALDALNPPATELLKRVNQAVKNHVSEAGYADDLIAKLSGTPREQAQALIELRHLGSAAVPPLLKSISNPQPTSSEVIALTLARLGSDAIAPLVGALTSPDPSVRAISARVLGQLNASTDSIWLWSPAFRPGEAAGVQVAAREALARIKYGNEATTGRLTSDGIPRLMLATATQYLSGKYKWPEMYDDVEQIPVWVWDDAEGTVVEHPVSRTFAGIFYAERLAREAGQLAPELQQAPVVLLASLFARDVEQNQWKLPLPSGPGTVLDLALSSGPDICEQVLQYALDQKLISVALGSLQALSQNGSAALLTGTPPHGAVQAALDAPDARVQFAAAVTILNWEPTRNFRGAKRVVEILARTVNSEAAPASVVMDPNRLRANETASMFTELGFTAALAPTGMDGFRIAAERGNIELAVMHPNVIRWELSQTIANLRADARTASIPVIIYGPASIRDDFDRISHEFSNVAYVEEASVPVEINRHLRPLLAQLSPPQLTSEQRKQQIQEASFWLRRIAIRNVENVFPLASAEEAITKSLGDPTLAEDALVTLGAIGSASAQKTLFLAATAPALDAAVRSLAASQLAFHIQHYGQLITPDEAKSLKSALDAEMEPATRSALASVIGTLKPTPAAARKLLLESPQSITPIIPAPQ